MVSEESLRSNGGPNVWRIRNTFIDDAVEEANGSLRRSASLPAVLGIGESTPEQVALCLPLEVRKPGAPMDFDLDADTAESEAQENTPPTLLASRCSRPCITLADKVQYGQNFISMDTQEIMPILLGVNLQLPNLNGDKKVYEPDSCKQDVLREQRERKAEQRSRRGHRARGRRGSGMAGGHSSPQHRSPLADKERPNNHTTTTASQQRGPGASCDEVLARCSQCLEQLTAGELVSELRLVAKIAEAEGDLSPQCIQQHGQALANDPRLLAVVRRLPAVMGDINCPRDFMNIFWAMGKVGLRRQDADVILQHASRVMPPLMSKFSSMELSNILWGLARLSTNPDSVKKTVSSRALALIARAAIDEGMRKLDTFGDQCLVNSLWSVAKLEIRGEAVTVFVHRCIEKTRQSHLPGFLPQGLANSLWAVARCCQDENLAQHFCVDVCEVIMTTPAMLRNFLPQELSMGVWAVARIIGSGVPTNGGSGHRGRGYGRGARVLPEAVEAFALAAALEAHVRIDGLSPQALSNLAWAFVTMDLFHAEPVRGFILTGAVLSCSTGLKKFSPQAIANLCWALSKISDQQSITIPFFEAATREAVGRASDFSWQDLASISSAMMHSGLRSDQSALAFTSWLVVQASGRCYDIGTQALLNVGVAAKRLGVAPAAMHGLALEMSSVFAGRPGLNEIDMRQWTEVCQYCNLPGPLSH